MVKKIIINFPTNLGDAIIGLPVLDRLHSNYPQAKISAITSPQTHNFFMHNRFIDEVILFDKSWKLQAKIKFCVYLRGKYDLIADLKNSFLPVALNIRKRTPFIRRFSNKVHIEDKYLSLISKIAPKESGGRSDFILENNERDKWDSLEIKKAIFIACSSRSSIKQYPYARLKDVVSYFKNKQSIIILGQKQDRGFYKDILKQRGVIDLVGKTSMWDVFYLLKKYASLLLGVDSSITHLASYLGLPVVCLFGPSSYERSYPRSKYSVALCKKELDCLPCEMAKCKRDNECMKITSQEVITAINKTLENAKTK
ncbi:MAG: glycosyltransferase family 9 protein [Candidatus Omnitrophica bacterium]|nr:glycosyltransferase family 9 protein [Candidatus Omnitrophota bacterium]